jgi:tetratricopeptide (TPR) repeat protein
MTNEVRKLNEALSLHRQGRLPEAAVQYAEVIKRNPRNYQALHFLGVIKATQGLIAEAKDLMQRALSAKPLPAGFVENYATLLAQTEEYDKAISVLEKLPAQTKASETIQYILAVCLYKTGRYGEAADAFERVLAVNPKHLAALNEKGSALAQLERYDEAVECIERALALNPSYADAVQNRAGILQKTGRHDEALLAYEKAIRLGLKPPLLAEAWLGAGIAHAEMGQTTNALSSYQNALKIKPDLIPAWIARGYVLRRLKRYEEALAAYDKALALDPSSAEAWHGRGNALLEQKRYLDAFPALDKATTRGTWRAPMKACTSGNGRVCPPTTSISRRKPARRRSPSWREAPGRMSSWQGAKILLRTRP